VLLCSHLFSATPIALRFDQILVLNVGNIEGRIPDLNLIPERFQQGFDLDGIRMDKGVNMIVVSARLFHGRFDGLVQDGSSIQQCVLVHILSLSRRKLCHCHGVRDGRFLGRAAAAGNDIVVFVIVGWWWWWWW
jgi:hypothetical protein